MYLFFKFVLHRTYTWRAILPPNIPNKALIYQGFFILAVSLPYILPHI